MSDARRARFRELHRSPQLFVMPNAWDRGSARLIEASGCKTVATTSAGFAWSQGANDYAVTRAQVLAHTRELASTVELPINVDSERLLDDEPGGVAESVSLLHEAGAAGCSVEDWDPVTGEIEPFALALARVEAAVEAIHRIGGEPLVLTARCELMDLGTADLDETIRRLLAYRDAGAECLYAPGVRSADDIARIAEEVASPINVIAFEDTPRLDTLRRIGVRRISTGSRLASAAYRSALDGLGELLGAGTSNYARTALTPDQRDALEGARRW